MQTFCQEFGAPDRLTCDGSKKQTGKKTEFMQQVRKNDIDLLEFDEDFQEEFSNIVSNDDIKEADEEFTPEVFDDTYLNMELAHPSGDGAEPAFARVTKRFRDANGLPIGTAHDDPILDSRMYEVEYQDCHKSAMAANVIAQNLFTQVDAKTIVMFSLIRSLITVPMGRKLSNKTRF